MPKYTKMHAKHQILVIPCNCFSPIESDLRGERYRPFTAVTRVRIPLGSPSRFSLGKPLNKGSTGAQTPHFRYSQSGTNVAKSAISDCFLRNNAQQSSLKK